MAFATEFSKSSARLANGRQDETQNGAAELSKIRAICARAFRRSLKRTRERHPAPERHLYERIAGIPEDARSRVARSINTAMVHACALIGREIIELEQRGAERASYGEGS